MIVHTVAILVMHSSVWLMYACCNNARLLSYNKDLYGITIFYASIQLFMKAAIEIQFHEIYALSLI